MDREWYILKNDGVSAVVGRDDKKYQVKRPCEMSRSEFFRRLPPGSVVSQEILHDRFDLFKRRASDSA